MKLSHLLVPLVAPMLARAYLVSPPGPAAPGTSEDCSEWVQYSKGLTCERIVQFFGMTETQFKKWNPIVAQGSSCKLVPGLYYCVQVNFNKINVTSSTMFTHTSTATACKDEHEIEEAASTPSPIEPGMVGNCNKFHKVVSGDTCSSIAKDAGVSVSDIEEWNPKVGKKCANLWKGYFVCIGTKNGCSTTATTHGNAGRTPTPIEPGMVHNCKKFHMVKKGDTCASIAKDAGVSAAKIETWNPKVGKKCRNLWKGYYICVGV